jgi:putative inorganic carbon (HCO3(-)) transporter
MSQATMDELDARTTAQPASFKFSVASVLDKTVFVSLLCLIVITAIPYGTTQSWWEALFVCAVFLLAILWLVEGLINGSWLHKDSWPLLLPLVALAALALLQTVSLGTQWGIHDRSQTGNPGGISLAPWYTISADPYETRFFVLLLLALMLAGVLLARYISSERRLRIVINFIIGTAAASAIFGILRQTMQHSPGFGLSLLLPEMGYGQFINKNHFAYLMEMGLGLILGLILGGGVKRDRALIYFAALLPLWTGLVLCGSRGGLVAMVAQVIVAALLFSAVVSSRSSGERNSSETSARLVRVTRSLPVRVALIAVLVAGVVLGTLWMGGDQLASRIEETRNELNADTTGLRQGVSRNEIWQATWQMVKAHPVLGVGLGGYWAAIPAFHNASGTMTPQEAHNDYLELLASGGVVGLAIGIWFAVVIFKRTRENLRSPNRFRRATCFGAAIGLTGVAVHSLVDFGLHTIVNAFVFTTLIVIATSKSPWPTERTTPQ